MPTHKACVVSKTTETISPNIELENITMRMNKQSDINKRQEHYILWINVSSCLQTNNEYNLSSRSIQKMQIT